MPDLHLPVEEVVEHVDTSEEDFLDMTAPVRKSLYYKDLRKRFWNKLKPLLPPIMEDEEDLCNHESLSTVVIKRKRQRARKNKASLEKVSTEADSLGSLH